MNKEQDNIGLAQNAPPGWWSLPEMRYPNAYTWLVLVASLDVLLTLLVLNVWLGEEVNPMASAVIDTMGQIWAVVLKYATVLFAIIICEIVGRKDDRMGRAIAYIAIVLNMSAVLYTFALLLFAGPAPLIDVDNGPVGPTPISVGIDQG